MTRIDLEMVTIGMSRENDEFNLPEGLFYPIFFIELFRRFCSGLCYCEVRNYFKAIPGSVARMLEADQERRSIAFRRE